MHKMVRDWREEGDFHMRHYSCTHKCGHAVNFVSITNLKELKLAKIPK